MHFFWTEDIDFVENQSKMIKLKSSILKQLISSINERIENK